MNKSNNKKVFPKTKAGKALNENDVSSMSRSASEDNSWNKKGKSLKKQIDKGNNKYLNTKQRTPCSSNSDLGVSIEPWIHTLRKKAHLLSDNSRETNSKLSKKPRTNETTCSHSKSKKSQNGFDSESNTEVFHLKVISANDKCIIPPKFPKKDFNSANKKKKTSLESRDHRRQIFERLSKPKKQTKCDENLNRHRTYFVEDFSEQDSNETDNHEAVSFSFQEKNIENVAKKIKDKSERQKAFKNKEFIPYKMQKMYTSASIITMPPKQGISELKLSLGSGNIPYNSSTDKELKHLRKGKELDIDLILSKFSLHNCNNKNAKQQKQKPNMYLKSRFVRNGNWAELCPWQSNNLKDKNDIKKLLIVSNGPCKNKIDVQKCDRIRPLSTKNFKFGCLFSKSTDEEDLAPKVPTSCWRLESENKPCCHHRGVSNSQDANRPCCHHQPISRNPHAQCLCDLVEVDRRYKRL